MITINENTLAETLAYNRMKILMPAIATNEVIFGNGEYTFTTENAEKVFTKWYEEYYEIIMAICTKQYRNDKDIVEQIIEEQLGNGKLISCPFCGELNAKGTIVCTNNKCREVLA